jgi:hypothetical protein
VNGVCHKGFKDFYGMDDDALVVAVYAGSDAASTRFSLNISSAWTTYALIDESGMGANGWTIDTPAYTAADGYDDRVLTFFGWGSGTHHGILAAENMATVYVPANAKPDVYNGNVKAALDEGESYTDKNDYIEINYVDGYKELAVVDFEQAPTPGVVPAWQLAYIAASKGEAFDATAINSFVKATVKVPEKVEDSAEDKIDINFKDRSELGNKGQNKKQDTGKKKGMSTLVLILIIVGAVLVLGGVAAVVVFVVILPKKKKAAVAAAPVAAAEEAPAVEEKTEE